MRKPDAEICMSGLTRKRDAAVIPLTPLIPCVPLLFRETPASILPFVMQAMAAPITTRVCLSLSSSALISRNLRINRLI